MATQWPGYVGGIAVGIDVSQSPSTVTSSTGSVTLTWTIYARNDSTHWTGSYSWQCSGAKSSSGSGNTGNTGTFGTTWKVTSFTTTVATSYSGTVSASLTASVTWTSTGATPQLKRTVTVGKRPPSKPSPPTSASVATGTGDDNVVTWGRPSNAGSAATVWDNTLVQVQYSGGTWTTIATLTGTATTYTDSGRPRNLQMYYRVAGRNSSGQSAWVTTTAIQTTPTAPTGVKAVRSGADIAVSWTDNSPYNSSWKIEDSADGSTWSTVAASYTGKPPYTHVSPSTAVTHRYRITAVTRAGRVAVSATSNVVTLISPPAAPSGLGPAVVATGSAGPFVWTHNPTDTSAQTAYEVLWSTDGTTWTDTGQITSTDSSWDATAACAAAATVQWQVRTWGVDATPGPYSAITNTVVSSTPSVSITSPGATVDLSSVTIDWTYAQAESSAQGSWLVRVTDPSGTVVATGTALTADTSWTSGSVLANDTAYTASVTVTSAAGLSTTATQAFTVSYQPPLAPTVTLDDHVPDGYITVTMDAPSNGVAPAPVQLVLERSIDGGEWQALWLGDVTSAVWLDYGCSLTGSNSYRVTANSALPSSAQTVATYQSPVLARSNYVILGTGAGVADVLRFSLATQADLSAGRAVTLNQFAGRPYPVATHGEAITRTIAVTCRLAYPHGADDLEAQRDTIEAIFLGDQPTLYRDTLGRRFWCSLSAVSVPSVYLPEASFTVTQVDPGLGVAEGVTG